MSSMIHYWPGEPEAILTLNPNHRKKVNYVLKEGKGIARPGFIDNLALKEMRLNLLNLSNYICSNNENRGIKHTLRDTFKVCSSTSAKKTTSVKCRANM
jgi:hypothetical protein